MNHRMWVQNGRLGRRAVLLIGALGLVLAFAGSAAGASLITGKDIKDGTLTSGDLRDGGLRGVDVRNGSLTRTDFGKLPTGLTGDPGGQGLPGPDGVVGVRHQLHSVTVLALGSESIDVRCVFGSHVVGGGVSSDHPENAYIEHSAQTSTGWKVLVFNTGSRVITVTAVAVCAQ